MILIAVAVAVALVVAVVLVVVLTRRSRPRDGVELFQRQIDALSPEARRPVIDRVHELEDDDDRGERRA